VNGRALQYFVNNAATNTVIPNLTNTNFRAATGSFSWSGVGDADGGFSIPEAPTGELFVSSNFGTYVETDGGALDFSTYQLGRANVVRPAAGTTLTLQSNKMLAWKAGDDIEFVSPGAGLSFGDLSSFGFPTPAAGATTLDAGVNYTEVLDDVAPAPQGGLIDSTQSDSLYVTHLVNQPVTSAIASETALREAYVVTTLKMIQGSAANVANKSFSDAGTPGEMAATYPAAEFAAIRSANAQSVELVSDTLYVDALIQGESTGGFFGGPDLVVANLNASATDVSLSLNWLNPFPSSWPLVVNASQSVAVDYTEPGSSTTQWAYGSTTVQTLYDGTHSPALAPAVGTVSSLHQQPDQRGPDANAGLDRAENRNADLLYGFDRAAVQELRGLSDRLVLVAADADLDADPVGRPGQERRVRSRRLFRL